MINVIPNKPESTARLNAGIAVDKPIYSDRARKIDAHK